MKKKYRIVVEILLVLAAIAVFIYNLAIQREVAYLASVIAVCGTIFLLARDIIKSR